MAMPSYPNAISFNDLKTEFGAPRGDTNPISFEDYYAANADSGYVRTVDTVPNVPTVPGNAISLGNFHGAARASITTVTGYPSAYTVLAGSWSNPTSAYSVDGSFAYTTPPADGTEYGIKLYNFGFDALIPSGKTIAQVRMYSKTACGVSGQALFARLQAYVTAGTTGVERSPWVGSTTLTEQSYYVSARDGSWDRSELLDGSLYVETYCGGEIELTSKQYRIDCIWFQVDYVN